jgi:hypothetical protein
LYACNFREEPDPGPVTPIYKESPVSLLTAIQQACNEMGLVPPVGLIGNTDPTYQQILALAIREGNEFASMGSPWTGWPELRKECTFSLNPAGPYTGTIAGGSNVLTNLSSTTGLAIGYGISGSNIAQSATIAAINPGVSVTMSIAASGTATLANQAINFGQIAYPLPSDYAYMISQTNWDRNFRWQMLGPLDAQEWQTLVSGISPGGPRLRFRIMNNLFYVQPLPGPGQTDQIVFEYISNAWCTSQAGAPQSSWQADTDAYVFPEDLLTLGLIWRWRRAKGLDYAEEKLTYDRAVERRLSRSGGVRAVPLNASGHGVRLLNPQNVPDTGFGS